MWQKCKPFFHNVWVAVRTGCTFYCFCRYGGFVSGVYGPSMFPTFGGKGDLVLADAFTVHFGTLEPGDVVICIKPEDPRDSVIKRVVAVAGQEVTLHPNKTTSFSRNLKVPPGHIWIEGDNPTMSRDSRDYGPVPLGLVRGRVFFQLYPHFHPVERRAPHARFGSS